jgi:uncharacterized protein YtpQ (UPF0354 family)
MLISEEMPTMTLLSVLSGWLTTVSAKKRRFADIAEFREFVIAACKRQPGIDSAVIDSSDPAKFKITMGKRSLTCDVTNIFGHLGAYPDEDADKAVKRFIRSFTDAKVEAISDDDIVAVIRNQEYIDYVKRMGIDILCEPFGADLMIAYMADRPDSMSPIAPKDVPGKDLQSVREAALTNMRKWLAKLVADGQLQLGVLYFVEDNTMLSTGLILLDEFWKSIETRFPGDVLIALPRRDQLFILDDGNSAAKALARRLIDVTTRENFNLLSDKLYARRNGEIVLVAD